MPDPRQRRYPWADLEAFATGRGWSVPELAAHAGKHRSEFHLWRREGSVPEYAADKVAVALGTTPDLIWGDAWAAVGRAVAEAEHRKRLDRNNARSRERYRVDAEYRERNLAASRAYKAAAKDAERIKDTLRRDANRNRKNANERARWHRMNLSDLYRSRYANDPAYRAAKVARQREYDRARREALREGLHLRGHPGREGGLQGGQNGLGKIDFRNYGTPATTSTSPAHAPTATSASPIHAQPEGKSLSNPHGSGSGSVTDRWDNGTTEQEVA